MSTSPTRPSNPNTAPNSHTHTNPTTPSPLSPFPSTPYRPSYLTTTTDPTNTTTSTTTTTSTPSTSDHPNLNIPHSHTLFTAEHISPTKAAATTRLNHELSTLTSWLEGLFGEAGIPSHLSRWRNEVLLSEQAGFDGPVLGSFEANLSQAPNQTRSTNQGQPPHRGTTPGSNTSLSPLDLLKSLKQINLSSDYLASLLHDARLEELHALQTRHSQLEKQRAQGIRSRTLLDEVHGYLTPDAADALRSLSEAAIALGLDLDSDYDGDANGNASTGATPGPKDLPILYARAILLQSHRKFTLEEQLRDLETLQHRIGSRLNAQTPSSENKDNPPPNQEPDEHHTEQLHTQTAQFNRDTKQINLKIMEYHDRVTSLERQLASLRTGSISLEDVLSARARVEERRVRVKALQERFAAFNGLPPDLEESRNEVRRAMAELESLKRRREGLFERMGTG